jgi:ABC-2 type transport system ATP-binding protein
MRNTAISTRQLTKRYGERAVVNHLSVDVPSGVVCGFIGRNGAGKTTTIRMLLGLIDATSGTAEVLGRSSTNPATYLHEVGAMIEGPAFYPTLTGRQNLEVLRRLGGLSTAAIDHSLETVDLADRADELVKGYSLGMRQRLGIAAALLPAPKLLVLDEPTNGLDPQGIREVRELLGRFADDGMTVLVSSHLLDELQHVAGHLLLIHDGTLMFQGTASELLHRSQSTLVVRTERSSDLVALEDLVKGHGFDPKRVEQGIAIVGSDDAFAAKINRAAAASGLTLAHIATVAPRLEDIFFDLTAQSHHAISDGAPA